MKLTQNHAPAEVPNAVEVVPDLPRQNRWIHADTVSSAEVRAGPGEHAVLFYDRDSDLAETVAGYLAGVLRAGVSRS